MTRLLLTTLALAGLLATTACEVTGTAAPSSAAAHDPNIPIGSPGFGAP